MAPLCGLCHKLPPLAELAGGWLAPQEPEGSLCPCPGASHGAGQRACHGAGQRSYCGAGQGAGQKADHGAGQGAGDRKQQALQRQLAEGSVSGELGHWVDAARMSLACRCEELTHKLPRLQNSSLT